MHAPPQLTLQPLNYLMHHYNWVRPHQYNDGLAPAKTEEKLKTVSGIS